MKVRKLGLLGAVAALAAVPMSADADSPRDRATGGGQLLLEPNDPSTGALDTLAFTAQREKGATDESGLADGQVQVNRRSSDDSSGNEAPVVKFHGVVECLIVQGSKSEGRAYISGYQKGTRTEDDPDGVPFELFVIDGGSGAGERGADQGMVWYGPETERNEPDNQVPPFTTGLQEPSHCGIEEEPESKQAIPALARGNYQVYDASGAAAAQQRSTKSSLSLSALR